MRPILFFAIFCTLIMVAFSGCKKNNGNNYAGSLGCITRVTPLAIDRLLGAAAFDTVKTLYQANGISLDIHQPQFIEYLKDSSGRDLIKIDSRRFINGLISAFGFETYSFFNGDLVDSSSWDESGAPENPDSAARIPLDDLRKIFLDSHPDNYSVENIDAGKKNVTHWADSCVEATLLYDEKWLYDSTVAVGSNIYVKVWYIYTAGRSLGQPVTVVFDDNSKVIPVQYARLILPFNAIRRPANRLSSTHLNF